MTILPPICRALALGLNEEFEKMKNSRKAKNRKNMEKKHVSIIVVYQGVLPSNYDPDEVEEQVDRELDDYLRLHFKATEEEYDEDVHEPFFERHKTIIADNGYRIITM